jgi:hypothetical protein
MRYFALSKDLDPRADDRVGLGEVCGGGVELSSSVAARSVSIVSIQRSIDSRLKRQSEPNLKAGMRLSFNSR